MYNVNYMEGVPVKIAEKYKPPPEIYKLPQSLVNKLNLANNYYQDSTQFQYDMQLERKALSKIVEWKRIRQRNKDARRERIERRELQSLQSKQEDERRQKNLLCSVSYPSADDLSSSGSECEAGEQVGTPQYSGSRSKESTAVAESLSQPQICVTESTNSFHNILQPTVLSNYSSSATQKSTINNMNPLLKSTQLMTFNYKDFEDDTSSPFDNIELKTINDLDVLAQVLHNTQIKSATAADVTHNNDVDDGETKAAAAANNANDTQNNEVNSEHGYIQSEKFLCNDIPKHNNLPKFSYDFGNLNSAQEAQNKLNDYSAAAKLNANLSPALSPQTYIGLEQQRHGHYVNANNHYYNDANTLQTNVYTVSPNTSAVTQSKSVPDILKELRDEIRNSELRRTRNCSHNLGNKQKIESPVEETRSEVAPVEDIFCNLDSQARLLAEQISNMGFPKQRVARIVELLGVDDKKIIEHLIPLSELADLGFDETEISKALLRHENNKNKALDDLIS